MQLLSLLTAAGLAAGAGGRAMIPALLLGLFHHTDWFELAPQFQWLASPAVLGAIGAVALLEIVADLHPEWGELADVAGYVTKFGGGFLAVAAATGTVDDSLGGLLDSGLLGGAGATLVHYAQTRVRTVSRHVGQATHHSVDRGVSAGGTAVAAGISVSAIAWPLLVPAFCVAGIALAWGALRALRKLDGKVGSLADAVLGVDDETKPR